MLIKYFLIQLWCSPLPLPWLYVLQRRSMPHVWKKYFQNHRSAEHAPEAPFYFSRLLFTLRLSKLCCCNCTHRCEQSWKIYFDVVDQIALENSLLERLPRGVYFWRVIVCNWSDRIQRPIISIYHDKWYLLGKFCLIYWLTTSRLVTIFFMKFLGLATA